MLHNLLYTRNFGITEGYILQYLNLPTALKKLIGIMYFNFLRQQF